MQVEVFVATLPAIGSLLVNLTVYKYFKSLVARDDCPPASRAAFTETPGRNPAFDLKTPPSGTSTSFH
jgi:hypothetical protein